MPQTEPIYEALKADLTTDRVLLEQVLNYIRDHYGFANEELETFFTEKYLQLEEYEVDLTFSPQFTPTASDRLRYVTLLGKGALSGEQVTALARRLDDEKLNIGFSTPDNLVKVTAPLHEVMSARYLKLMKLDRTADADVFAAVEDAVPSTCHPLANMLVREDVWQGERRKGLLKAFLALWKHEDNYNGEKLNFLTSFLRTYRPDGLVDLAHQLESLIQSCQADMENMNGRGFHDEYLKAMYSGQPQVSHLDDSEKGVWGHYYHLMEMAELLLKDIRQMDRVLPEYVEQAKTEQQPA